METPTTPTTTPRGVRGILPILLALSFGACSMFATPQESLKSAATTFSQACSEATASLGDQAVQCTPDAFGRTAIQAFGGNPAAAMPASPAAIPQPTKPADPVPTNGPGVIKIYQ